jgi:hypothetical protein
MGEFNEREWFKKQYLEEANIKEERMSKEDAFKALRDIEANMGGKMGAHYTQLMGLALDHLQAAEITAMMDRERSLREDDLDEIAFGDANSDKRTGQVAGEIIELIRSTGVDPSDMMDAIGEEYGISFEFGRG